MDRSVQINLYNLRILGFIAVIVVLGIGTLLLIKGSRHWFKRRFKELDLLEEYFPRLFTRWQAAIWGGSVLAVTFGWHFVTSDWPYPVKLTVCVVALFFAGYYVWRVDHLRLIPQLEIAQVKARWFRDPAATKGTILYYFEVVNKSEVSSIEWIQVELVEMEPEIKNANWLPAALRQTQDSLFSTQAKKDFTLNPGQRKDIDFVSARVGQEDITIHHLVSAQNIVSGKKQRQYKISIAARDMAPCFVWFNVWINSEGVLQCERE